MNELDHELRFRLNRAYKPSVKYMDLFTHPLLVVLARNVAFFAGAILAVLLALTVIQGDLLTAPNILKILTSLGKPSMIVISYNEQLRLVYNNYDASVKMLTNIIMLCSCC